MKGKGARKFTNGFARCHQTDALIYLNPRSFLIFW